MSMRLEKGWGVWTLEFRPDFDAVESGMDVFINWKKDFVGKEATQTIRDAGPKQKLVTMTIEVDGIDVSNDEAILKDGEAVGYISSDGFAHRSGTPWLWAMFPLRTRHQAPLCRWKFWVSSMTPKCWAGRSMTPTAQICAVDDMGRPEINIHVSQADLEGISRFVFVLLRGFSSLDLGAGIESLAAANMRVIEVAIACGFASASHFSKLYRKQFGTSPRTERGAV